VGLAYVIGLGFVVYTLMQAGAGLARHARSGCDSCGRAGSMRRRASRLGFGRALGRNLVWALGGAIVVGYFFFDSSPWHRGWHDRAARPS
jgi:hypothetical protein